MFQKKMVYVSHNMNTIRQLCDRCVVLDHGKVIFDGDVEEAIAIYSHVGDLEKISEKDLSNLERYSEVQEDRIASFQKVRFIGKNQNFCEHGDNLEIELSVKATKKIEKASVRFTFWSKRGYAVGSSFCIDFSKLNIGENSFKFSIPIQQLESSEYDVGLTLLERSEFGSNSEIDVILSAFTIRINENHNFYWSPIQWGHIRLPDTIIE